LKISTLNEISKCVSNLDFDSKDFGLSKLHDKLKDLKLIDGNMYILKKAIRALGWELMLQYEQHTNSAVVKFHTRLAALIGDPSKMRKIRKKWCMTLETLTTWALSVYVTIWNNSGYLNTSFFEDEVTNEIYYGPSLGKNCRPSIESAWVREILKLNNCDDLLPDEQMVEIRACFSGSEEEMIAARKKISPQVPTAFTAKMLFLNILAKMLDKYSHLKKSISSLKNSYSEIEEEKKELISKSMHHKEHMDILRAQLEQQIKQTANQEKHLAVMKAQLHEQKLANGTLKRKADDGVAHRRHIRKQYKFGLKSMIQEISSDNSISYEKKAKWLQISTGILEANSANALTPDSCLPSSSDESQDFVAGDYC